jgi:hypothetical protein
MLESAGACLTLAVAYTYLRVRQEPAPATFRWLALALTGLFFLKYNYWLLALFGVLLAELSCHVQRIVSASLGVCRTLADLKRLRGWSSAQMRQPLTYPLLLVVGVLVAYAVRGPFWIVRSADTLATVACWLMVARVLPWWWRAGRHQLQAESPNAATIVAWHVWPVVVWFLLPKRAALFVSYLTRDHGAGEGEASLLGRLTAYAQTLVADYHAGIASAFGAVTLAVVGLLLTRRLRGGAGVILALVVVASILTVAQPTCRSRFLHSWLAVVWVAAGVGLASAIYAWRPHRALVVRHGIAIVALAILAIVCGRSATAPGHAPEGGVNRAMPSALELAEGFLPDVQDSRRVAVISNHSLKFFAMWTYQERYRNTERVLTDVDALPVDGSSFAAWADRHRCDAVVWIDVPQGSVFYAPPEIERAQRLSSSLASQSGFVATQRRAWPDWGCSVTVWLRADWVAGSR